MWNKKLVTFLRYYILLLITVGIIVKNKNINSAMIIFIFIFIINNQLRFFSLEKNYQKIISFAIELIFITISYRWIGGYLITYLILSAIDSNILFDRFMQSFFNIAIAFIGVCFSYNENLEFKFVTLGILGVIIAILYFIKDENDKKLQAQVLYDKLRISEEKLVKANRDLEVYASSIEELTLLRERNRISREIHDSVGHALSAIVIQLGAIERTLGKSHEVTGASIKELKKFAQNSLKDVRSAVREIKPKEFEEFEGILVIEELINNFRKLTGVDVRLAFTKEKWPLSSDQAFVVYRIIQEFLANSIRHGKANLIQIFMAFTEYKLVVTLKDNGKGAESLVEGMGLKSMRERVMEIGGTFEYNTKTEQGFLVKLELDKKEKLKIHSQGDNNGEDKDYIS